MDNAPLPYLAVPSNEGIEKYVKPHVKHFSIYKCCLIQNYPDKFQTLNTAGIIFSVCYSSLVHLFLSLTKQIFILKRHNNHI
jgi:hypothetical protein